MAEKENWTLIIEPNRKLLALRLKEIWRYRDLLEMYIRRNIVTFYKQTILGPLWFFIQPVFTTIVYMFVFGGLAGIPTDGIPQPLFYLSGICLWNYFSESLLKTSETFSSNYHVFGKVYFPRLIAPLSVIITGLVKLTIQLCLFFSVYLYFHLKGSSFAINQYALLFPLLVMMLGLLAFSYGIIISSLTIKYRDLKFLIAFGVHLWMYATPVIYPLSVMQGRFSDYMWVLQINPITSIMEAFKAGFLGEGTFSMIFLAYSACHTLLIMCIGIIIFNKAERNFMDVI